MSEQNEKTNRLANESSPYLLQHRFNPVDWYPWGPEAFAAARELDRPIFLSVGYSTCYWCHVMERESFENPDVAAEMNRRFINIKVDREERPDVDQLYMTAVQLLSRQGGWPMSVFLLPDLRPFYGGTYFPPRDYANRPGFASLLRGIDEACRDRRSEVVKSAGQVTEILQKLAEPTRPRSPIVIDGEFVSRLVQRSVADYDPRQGGFGAAPKFPRQTLLELLLRYNRAHPSQKLLGQICHTLDAMTHGGIRDQLGGGFHRYSTDADWLVPHFEIMLYDNAMLGWCYIEAYRQTEDRRYSAVARGIFDFVLREMTSPDGAFFTAFDAEVDAREGASYLWNRSEVEATLAEALGADPKAEEKIHRFCRIYGLDDGPNFADPHHGNGRPDSNILFLAEPAGDGQPALLDPELAALREILLTARRLRKQPLLDTKIITSWNALMIRSLALGGQVLQEPRYLQAASKAAGWLMKEHRTSDDGLYRTSRDGQKRYDGFLDDYAFMVQAMIALHDAGANENWHDSARALSRVMLRKFLDADHGAFYFSAADVPDLIIRQKIATDTPLPSGVAIAARVMLQLGEDSITRDTLIAFAAQLESQGEGMSALLETALAYLQDHAAITAEPPRDESAARASIAPSSPREMAARIVKITSTWADASTLNVMLAIKPEYHISAHDHGAALMATQLAVVDSDSAVAAIDFPPGEKMSFAFSDEVLPVYTGNVMVTVRFPHAVVQATVRLSLSYQACDDSACLPMVSQVIDVPGPAAG